MTQTHLDKALVAIEEVLRMDPGHRGVPALLPHGTVESAARSLLTARSVLIVTGFTLPDVGRLETDGPPGARALGEALARRGVAVHYATDPTHVLTLTRCGLSPTLPYHDAESVLRAARPTHVVALERPGRAADGRYYSMAGVDISATVAPIDGLFLPSSPSFPKHLNGYVRIGIGDGGNEMGMGLLRLAVRACIANGERIATVTDADHTIVGGTSNWAAWGVLAAMGTLLGLPMTPSSDAAWRHLSEAVQAGVVDSGTRTCCPQVDGHSWATQCDILERLRGIEAAARMPT